MIEKLKQFGESAKGVLLFIIAPILAVLAYISYIRNQLQTTKDQLNESKAAQQLATVIEKKVEDEKQSNVDELDYDTIRAQYLAEHPGESSGLHASNQSSGQDDSSKGSSA